MNTYLLTDESTGKAAIVDTGETHELVQKRALSPAPDIQILTDPHHLDHAGALTYLQEVWDVPTYMPADRPLFETLPMQGTLFRMPHLNRPWGASITRLSMATKSLLGATLGFCASGHTPGQGCYYDDHDIVVGDTLWGHWPNRLPPPTRPNRGEPRRLMALLDTFGCLRPWPHDQQARDSAGLFRLPPIILWASHSLGAGPGPPVTQSKRSATSSAA